ncbi:MAG TPA: ATP-binding protein, partial [Cellulomonas sp.]
RSLAGVPALVATAGAGGRAVVLPRRSRAATAGVGDGVGPLAQLAGYRMVQESLANAARHAPGAGCTVELDDRDDAEVVLVVRNAATTQVPVRTPGGGTGLRGMRERAELVGADLRYGPTVHGGWEVRLALPREPATHPVAGAAGEGRAS